MSLPHCLQQKQQLISDAQAFSLPAAQSFPKEVDLGNGVRYLPLIVTFRRVKKKKQKKSNHQKLPSLAFLFVKTGFLQGLSTLWVRPNTVFSRHGHGRKTACAPQGTSALEIFELVRGDYIIRKFWHQGKNKPFKNKILKLLNQIKSFIKREKKNECLLIASQLALKEEAGMYSKKQQRHTYGRFKHTSSNDDSWTMRFSFVDSGSNRHE